IDTRPDTVIVATGSRNRPMTIAGIDSAMVLDAFEVLMGNVDHGLQQGQHVVIYGGGDTGCEAAEYFADKGIVVTLITRSSLKELARGAEMVYRKVLVSRLTQNKTITIVANTHITHIGDGNID